MVCVPFVEVRWVGGLLPSSENTFTKIGVFYRFTGLKNMFIVPILMYDNYEEECI